MKRLTFFAALTALLAVTAHAQVLNQASVKLIRLDNPAADPYLCVFGNTIEDVTLIDRYINLDRKEVMYLRQREEVNLHQTFRSETERSNANYLSIHIIQRRLLETNGGIDIEVYFLVDVYERVGNRYYFVASSR
ncbi:MAG: hypothetical protein LBC76_11605 [Treponema sp.]|nr:hypothetical protein [Treponema sp.]